MNQHQNKKYPLGHSAEIKKKPIMDEKKKIVIGAA